MSFLYVVYLVAFYGLNLAMSSVRDNFVRNGKSLVMLYVLIGGVFMTVAGFIVLVSTFVPRGSWAFNPVGDEMEVSEVDVEKKNEQVEEPEIRDSRATIYAIGG